MRSADLGMRQATVMRSYDPEATRRAIMTSARRIFMTKGVARTSLSAIARDSNITKSLIHHHFGSKEALWNEVKYDTFQPYYAGILAIIRREQSDLECLRDAIIFMFRFFQERPELSRLMMLMYWENDRSCAELEGTVMRESMARLTRAQGGGQLRNDIHPWVLQTTLINLVNGWFLVRPRIECWDQFDQEDPRVDETYLDEVLDLFMEGARPR